MHLHEFTQIKVTSLVQKYKTREYVVAGKAVTDAATGVPCLYNLSDVEHHNHNPLNLKRMGLTSVYG